MRRGISVSDRSRLSEVGTDSSVRWHSHLGNLKRYEGWKGGRERERDRECGSRVRERF